MNRFKRFWKQYGHGAWIVSYLLFYVIGFAIVENAGHRHYHVIHTVIDDLIPFNEYFIIPYYLWFAYMAGGICWFVFACKNKSEYYKLCCTLSIGMTVFLIVSCVFPNCQDMRPTQFLHQNIFTRMVQFLYRSDTPTNILPSIHVYNSLVLFFALNGSPQLQRYRKTRFAIGVLTCLIILSTMFLKQHSVVDVSMGILMAFAVQMLCDRVFDTDTRPAGETDTDS